MRQGSDETKTLVPETCSFVRYTAISCSEVLALMERWSDRWKRRRSRDEAYSWLLTLIDAGSAVPSSCAAPSVPRKFRKCSLTGFPKVSRHCDGLVFVFWSVDDAHTTRSRGYTKRITASSFCLTSFSNSAYSQLIATKVVMGELVQWLQSSLAGGL